MVTQCCGNTMLYYIELTGDRLLCYPALLSTLSRELQHLVEEMDLLAVVREKLLSAGQPVTIGIFNGLFEVIIYT